jgi:hypothetical protein
LFLNSIYKLIPYNYSPPAFTWTLFGGYVPITSGIYTIGQSAVMPLGTMQAQFLDSIPYHRTHDGPGPDGGANTPQVNDDQMTRTTGHF